MSDKTLPFVVNDRRKFTAEGEARPDAPPSEAKSVRDVKPAAEPISIADSRPQPVGIGTTAVAQGAPKTHEPSPEYAPTQADPGPAPDVANPDDDLPPPPTPEQMEQSRLAYQATADRLTTAIRAANPGMDHPPAVSFEQLVQSLYMQGIMQLGGGTPEGQQPQVDLLGAGQSIDMLGLLSEKTIGNLSQPEQVMVDSAVFELRLAYLEITQALARSAQQRAGAAVPAMPGAPGARPGPNLVR